ncbi:hypothetical protein BDL97_19G079600 [Sphagnum fallax]|nr:hypothetical protein BDL97_19G079600 [Sphagnum fallax]KAH8932551.1 hypothetical protein BDL97_19G079600 [Sphagnum fallax]KAH8932554.1 hypothetical protein BDL97_19G079600 [Sphagnum fallax]
MKGYCCSDEPLLLQQQQQPGASNNVWEFDYTLCRLPHVYSKCASTAVPSLAFPEASLPGEEFEGTGKQLPDVEEEESVLEYLKRQWIGTPFLNEVELPKSLAVVKERIEFLLKIGLTIKDKCLCFGLSKLQQLLLLGRKEKQENPWVH